MDEMFRISVKKHHIINFSHDIAIVFSNFHFLTAIQLFLSQVCVPREVFEVLPDVWDRARCEIVEN